MTCLSSSLVILPSPSLSKTLKAARSSVSSVGMVAVVVMLFLGYDLIDFPHKRKLLYFVYTTTSQEIHFLHTLDFTSR